MIFLSKHTLARILGLVIYMAVLLSNAPGVFAVERILDFSSSIEILKNSSLHVVERIEYDFDASPTHPVLRIFPTQVMGENGESKDITIDILSVTDNQSRTYSWKEDLQNDGLHLLIENPSSDSHMYVITYDVHGAVLRGDDKVEFSWGVVGGWWSVPISSVQATVRIPAAITGGDDIESRDVRTYKCQLIKEGSTSECFGEIQNTIALFSAPRSLAPQEEMRINLTFSRDQVSAASAYIENAQVWFSKYLYAIGGFATLVLLGFFVWWKKYKKSPLKSE